MDDAQAGPSNEPTPTWSITKAEWDGLGSRAQKMHIWLWVSVGATVLFGVLLLCTSLFSPSVPDLPLLDAIKRVAAVVGVVVILLIQPHPRRRPIIRQRVNQIAVPVKAIARAVRFPLIAAIVEPARLHAVDHRAVFQHRHIKRAAIKGNQAGALALDILKHPRQQIAFTAADLSTRADFAQVVALALAVALNVGSHKTDRCDLVKRLPQKVVFAAGDPEMIFAQRLPPGRNIIRHRPEQIRHHIRIRHGFDIERKQSAVFMVCIAHR